MGNSFARLWFAAKKDLGVEKMTDEKFKWWMKNRYTEA